MASNIVTYQSLSGFIQEGNIRGLALFLAAHHSQVDVRDENGQTVLMYASQQGEVNFVRELLKHSADVNAMDNDNWTPLLNACREGHAEVVAELLDSGAAIEHKDLGGWTALEWACYKGQTNCAKLLLEKNADPNVTGQYHVSCLAWAAGRGYKAIVRQLLNHGAKVNIGDKYGTTPLIWSCRKGYVEIADELLKAGANVDTAGMYSWTPLLVATKGNFPEVVHLLLDYKPNVNALDCDGYTALMIACKEGYAEIAAALLNAGAYVNLQDRNGDTNLIHAAKAGHLEVVDALLKKYADVDIQGTDRKTALYWAVEKGYVDIVKSILHTDPDMELATKDGDTPLMKATRNRNMEIVQALLDRKVKVSAADKKGDTALHIAMRAHSKSIVELLLRNPKHSQLLYRPNRNGETPYNIDSRHQRSILGQIFGARRLNTNEDNENMLGYDLYGSALADILSEPSLSMPICLGLYAKWGSGKSFLLGKLRDEMKNFAREWIEPTFEFSWLAMMVVLFISVIVGIIVGFVCHLWFAGITAGLGLFVLTLIFLAVVKFGCERYDWQYCYEISVYLARKMSSLKLFMQVLFCHPPQKLPLGDGTHARHIRFLFTDQTKVSGSGGDGSVAQIVSSLFTAMEHEYGMLTTRLYTVFKPKPVSSATWKWRRLCCVPYFFVFMALLLCVFGLAVTLGLFLTDSNVGHFLGYAGFGSGSGEDDGKGSGDDDDDDDDDDSEEDTRVSTRYVVRAVLITVSCILTFAIIANFYTLIRMLSAVCYPRKRRVVNLVSGSSCVGGGDGMKADAHLQPLRANVQLMSEMAKCLDGFTGKQTRLVVIMDGLDSCEQDKVLHNLDAVHLLFSDLGSPFIILLAIDPHVIIKAIEMNIHRVFHDSSISGHNYLRNIVHLPFYLQNSGLRRVRVAQKTAVSQRKSHSGWSEEANAALSARRFSSESSMSIPERVKQLRTNSKGSRKLKPSDSIASSVGNVGRPSGAQDLTRVLLTDDYFSDVNPRSMRRLMNVMYITGRLLKAFNIDFNWYHLASWVNITEQWPYRTSWIIFYYESNEESLEDNCSLKTIYEKIRDLIPTSKDVEPLLEIDRDERKFEVFLSFHKASLHVSDLKVFLPFTINLDPYIRKEIREEQQSFEEMSRMEVVPQAAGPGHPWIPSTSNNARAVNVLSEGRLTHRRPAAIGASKGAPSAAAGWMYQYPSPAMMVNPGAMIPSAPPSVWAGAPPIPTRALATAPPAPSHSGQDVPGTGQPSQLSSGHNLESLSLAEVCDLLDELEGISPNALQRYKDTLKENNIHGRVLNYCDLDELKKVMGMSFGDWELFRMSVLALRDPTSDLSIRIKTKKSITTAEEKQTPTAQEIVIEQHDSATKGSKVNDQDGSGRNLTRERSSSMKRHAAQPSSSSTLQKQVTLEDQMIMGALQALNEQAEEDARMERRSVSEQRDPPTTSPSPLSPILSNPEEDDEIVTRNVPQVTVDGGDTLESDDECESMDEEDETNVLYLRSHSATPLMPSPVSDADCRLSPRPSLKPVMDPTDIFWSENAVESLHNSHSNANNVIEMDHVVEWNDKTAKVRHNTLQPMDTSPSGENHLNRLKKLLASVSAQGSSSNGSLRHGHSRSTSESPNYDSDTENSESAPLVNERFPPATPTCNWAMNKVVASTTEEEDTDQSHTRPKTPSLSIDAPGFCPFRTIPSWPDIGALANASMSRSVQTSPVKPPVQKSWSTTESRLENRLPSAPSQDLIEMLGGSETVL